MLCDGVREFWHFGCGHTENLVELENEADGQIPNLASLLAYGLTSLVLSGACLTYGGRKLESLNVGKLVGYVCPYLSLGMVRTLRDANRLKSDMLKVYSVPIYSAGGWLMLTSRNTKGGKSATISDLTMLSIAIWVFSAIHAITATQLCSPKSISMDRYVK